MQIRIQVVRGPERPRRGTRRLFVGVTVVALAIAAPLAYAAVRSDIFTDVPSTAADHDAINRVYQAGIMNPCNTSPMQFCPNNTTLRRGIAKQYDYALGLSGNPGNFTPTFRGVNLKGAPLTTDSTARVPNLNADSVDDLGSSQLLAGGFATNGPGSNPVADGQLRFLAPSTAVDVAAGDWIYVVSTATLGSTSPGGASGLNLYICYQSMASNSPVVTWGFGIFGVAVPQNSRIPMTLSGLIPGLAPGQYSVGLCGYTTNANWNSNEYGYTTAQAFRPENGSSSVTSGRR